MSKPLTHTFGSAKYVYASAYDQIEADNDKLRGDLRHKTLQWEGVKDMLAQRTEENAKLREQLAKAQR